MILSPADLVDCASLITKMRRQLEKRSNNPPISHFESATIGPSDVVLRPNAFLSAAASAVGRPFVEENLFKEKLGILTAYLSEETPEQISLNKLRLAFTYNENDPPLP